MQRRSKSIRRTPGRTLTTAAAALAATAAFCVAVPAASADIAPQYLDALHAFVGDPLFGLDTAQGMLYGKLPDEETQMGSTTKIWTLDLTAHALEQGVVHLNDQVTIDPYEAGFNNWNSLMTSTARPSRRARSSASTPSSAA